MSDTRELATGRSTSTMTSARSANRLRKLPKTPTGISGLDEVTGGGLPTGRPTLVCGPAGCGKTLLAMEFLVRGITEFDEPGVFVAFEESVADLVANVASLGFDLAQLEADGQARGRPHQRGARRRWRRPATGTSKGCSFASARPSTPWAPSEW